jgi:hypothetical protein
MVTSSGMMIILHFMRKLVSVITMAVIGELEGSALAIPVPTIGHEPELEESSNSVAFVKVL